MASVSKKTYYKICVSEMPRTSAVEAYLQKKSYDNRYYRFM